MAMVVALPSAARAQLLPPPGDREIRAVYWELRNEAEVWLTLQPTDAAGKRSPMLTITHRFPGRQPAAPPSELEIRAYAGALFAPGVELWLVIDRRKIDLAAQTPAYGLISGTPSDYMSARISIETLRQIASADRVEGNALGVAFELRPAQRAAVAALIERLASEDPLGLRGKIR